MYFRRLTLSIVLVMFAHRATAQNCSLREMRGADVIFRNLGNVCATAERPELCLWEVARLAYQFKIQCRQLEVATLRGNTRATQWTLRQVEQIRDGTREFVIKYYKPSP
jgi:hypothetical protein